MTKVKDGSASYKMLVGLANNGPACREDMDRICNNLDIKERSVQTTITRMIDNGFIARKVVLTSEGLAELQRLGWKPKIQTGNGDEND